MKEIKDWLKSHQVLPRISFKDRQEHTIKIIQTKQESLNNDDGELVDGMKFKVWENEELKTFFTASRDLLMKLADCEENDVYKVKMCAKNVGGKVKSYYNVKKIEGENEIQVEPADDDIPVVEDRELTLEEQEVLDKEKETKPEDIPF